MIVNIPLARLAQWLGSTEQRGGSSVSPHGTTAVCRGEGLEGCVMRGEVLEGCVMRGEGLEGCVMPVALLGVRYEGCVMAGVL